MGVGGMSNVGPSPTRVPTPLTAPGRSVYPRSGVYKGLLPDQPRVSQTVQTDRAVGEMEGHSPNPVRDNRGKMSTLATPTLRV